MSPSIHVHEAADDVQEVTLISLNPRGALYDPRRPRSHSLMDLPPLDLDSAEKAAYMSDATHDKDPRRKPASLRLQLAIPRPPARPRAATACPPAVEEREAETTPLSESPQTPASLASPIAGVVDLTKDVTTKSQYAVAQGGLSDIYMGEWRRMDEQSGETELITIAIKLLRVMAFRDDEGVRSRKKLNREVYVWHRLEHPNVVKLFGTSYHMGGRPAMVMQWYKNGSASEYLAKTNPDADRLKLILDVARGLEYLHTMPNPIVHADLKGNNVLINDDGAAVLCDFGLSQVVEDLGRPAGLTLSNQSVGPPRWQAPELLEDEDAPATCASDVWSFGCTAFELLTSRLPYSHRSRDLHVMRDMQNRIKPPAPGDAALLRAFGARVCALLDSCWSFEISERPSMMQVRLELEKICAERSTT